MNEATAEVVELDLVGPVDYVVVEFPVDKADFSGAMANELKVLVDSGQIRVLDLVLIHKDENGEVEAQELHEHDESLVGQLLELEADLGMLLAADDVAQFGEVLEPGSYAAVLVYENRWAGPFAAAVRRSGGQLVANGRIHTQALLAAAEADAEGDRHASRSSTSRPARRRRGARSAHRGHGRNGRRRGTPTQSA